MYLKSIKAYGFKSFADKIDIELNNNITAIVGPNGSGKSNIVDAVKWVLGEQSVKSLRGTGSMSDVIFTGSKTRPALNRASVSLVFDNTDHYLNSDFGEVEVKRVVYQSGENEYYINNTKVRLKDIINLFLDTGVGNESLNIISQRKIESIVDSKPIERRTIFEEAACVLKYKKRKEESLRKLDKTNDNLEKLNLLIEELDKTVTPLKEQSDKAIKYNDLKEELKNIEISLIAKDITDINEKYTQTKEDIKALEEESIDITNSNKEDLANIELKKLEILKVEEKLNQKNNELLKTIEELSSLQSEKQITLERQKYELSKDDVTNNLIKLKEEELQISKNIDIITKEIDNLNENIKNKDKELSDISEQESLMKVKKNSLNNKLNELTLENYNLKSKKDILENTIENDTKLPGSIKNILNNPRLEGIHNIIYKLITMDEKYITAIDTALGANGNFLVVDDELVASKCINYLKENKLGRATFFPLNIIKGKSIDYETRNILNNIDGFIATANELVKCDDTYNEIIKNQLGNIVVVDNLDIANTVGKKINYKYRIVTLDGDIIHSGGSLTGGSKKNNSSILKDKEELQNIIKKIDKYSSDIENTYKKLKDLNKTLEEISNNEEKINRELINIREMYNSKTNKLVDLENELKLKKEEISGNEDLANNKLDEKIDTILLKVKELSSQKDIINLEIKKLKDQKQELNEDVEILENSYHKIAVSYNKLQSDIKDKEVLIGKFDIKLDNLLLNLTETYNITYEKAKIDYPLEIDENLARDKVNYLKKEILKLGEVNTGAISEYERLNTRYEFLFNQKNDLIKASQNLLEVINEMDEIMKEKFKATFDKISIEFSNVFKTMFKGGNGKLVLTDPDDILNSGIDIIAEPPGKKLKSNSFLSGGEKTLTAISLLFSILNVKPVPFCILDEVEAALDEANVELFGKYLKEKENKSQFILITHKKKTMEYADTLYGITMQESGVSKIVSVKLEEN
jgi:chromosome segregation protein